MERFNKTVPGTDILVKNLSDHYGIISYISRGAQGDVYKGVDLSSGRYVAIKKMDPCIMSKVPNCSLLRTVLIGERYMQDMTTEEELYDDYQTVLVTLMKMHLEVELLKSLSMDPECYQNILCYYDSFLEEPTGLYIIVTELVEGLTLSNYLQGLRTKLVHPKCMM